MKIALDDALIIADKMKIYAYDAYIIGCALKNRCPLISLDQGLLQAAKSFGITTMEVIL